MGSAEIYSVLEGFTTELEDTLCVAQRRPEDRDERVLLFLKMREGHKFNDQLVERIRKAIREARSPRHVPAFIFPIEDIPVSISMSLSSRTFSTQRSRLHFLVHCECQEDRNSRQTDRLRLLFETQRHCR